MDDISSPPIEPYRAAVTVLPDYPVASGIRRSADLTAAQGQPPKLSRTNLIPCSGTIIREQPHTVPQPSPTYLNQTSHTHKPFAAVVPRTSTDTPSSPRIRKSTNHVCTQTDDACIDMDLLFDIEDMLRTQRSVTLPKLSPYAFLGTQSTSESDDVQSLRLEIAELKEALDIQTKTNADLKRLLVSALAGNSTVADQLAGLTCDNAQLSGRSQDLAAQQAVLAEAVDSAGIAADVWRAKCLAGRVLAIEAARRLARANRRVQVARHALAHLLGERAQLRRELGQAAAILCSHVDGSALGTTVPVARDTLGLASICHRLASQIRKSINCPATLSCETDTLGERLSLMVLTDDPTPDDLGKLASRHSSAGDEVTSTLPPPPESSASDVIEQALKSFESTKSLGLDTPCLSTCRGCKGQVTSV